MKARLVDVLELSIHPVICGSGEVLFHEDETAAMKLVATTTYSKIVKLSFEPQDSSVAP